MVHFGVFHRRRQVLVGWVLDQKTEPVNERRAKNALLSGLGREHDKLVYETSNG